MTFKAQLTNSVLHTLPIIGAFGVTAIDMPYLDTWEDSEVEGMVVKWLKQFEV